MGMDIEYDLDALKKGLGKLDKNIQVLEQAVERERETKREYHRMIDVLEAKNARTKKA